MNTILRSDGFDAWLANLRDSRGKARILARIRAAEFGNFGDWKAVGDGVLEMRIDAGPGYRLYYTKRGKEIYLLLVGGDKSSQRRDVTRAKGLASQI
jgi:putative addiction module killer protein